MHPSFCANRTRVPCGNHLAEPTTLVATGDDLPVEVEISAAVTRDGRPGLAVTLVDPELDVAVTGVLRLPELSAAMAAMVSHGQLARDERTCR